MNYSYVNPEDAASSKSAFKNRYKVNHFAGQDTTAEEINAFRQFNKFKTLTKTTFVTNVTKRVILRTIAQGICLPEGMGE